MAQARSYLMGAVLAAIAVQCAEARSPSLPGQRFLPPKARLGMELFFDTNLSEPAGQACASCHTPAAAFTDPDRTRPTSKGVNPSLFGSRNSPMASYASFSPAFHYDKSEGLYVGGQFWDGRASTLEDQARQPFLNPVEMANPDAAAVVRKVRRADYAQAFKDVYGPAALRQVDKAYERIADAIAAFENTRPLNRFTSKYDAYLAKKVVLTASELNGFRLYEDPTKGNCAACHPSRPGPGRTPPLFTDFTYDNLGVPRNPANRFYRLGSQYNPAGLAFVDKGLGGALNLASEDGKFKVPSLRNIALTGPYMHNGYFTSLRAVVEFYNNRDVKPACARNFVTEQQALRRGCWPKPEVESNVNRDELGNLRLTDQEIDDIVAFLGTLTDGYRPLQYQ